MTASAIATLILLVAAPAWSQSLDDLKNDGKNTDNVLTYGMGYHQQRYSTLKQINKQNIKRLVPVWSVSLGSNYGEQAQPLVHDGIMFVTNAEATQLQKLLVITRGITGIASDLQRAQVVVR